MNAIISCLHCFGKIALADIGVEVVVTAVGEVQFSVGLIMLSTKEPQWIAVNNHALRYFGGVPALVVCDNCKQAVLVNA